MSVSKPGVLAIFLACSFLVLCGCGKSVSGVYVGKVVGGRSTTDRECEVTFFDNQTVLMRAGLTDAGTFLIKEKNVIVDFQDGTKVFTIKEDDSLEVDMWFGKVVFNKTSAKKHNLQNFDIKTVHQIQCKNNLFRINSAKEQWALQNRKELTAIPTEIDISGYLRNGRIPACPARGSYVINPINADAQCSIPEHNQIR
jgi:hypothetical protein